MQRPHPRTENLVHTILLVDDHHAFRTVMAEVLRTEGYWVLEAATATDAEHVVARHSGTVDALVVESVLTTANGVDVVRRIQPSHPKLPVLFISEEAEAALRRERLLPKRARFLRKPFQAEALLEELRRLLASGKRTGAQTARGSAGNAR